MMSLRPPAYFLPGQAPGRSLLLFELSDVFPKFLKRPLGVLRLFCYPDRVAGRPMATF